MIFFHVITLFRVLEKKYVFIFNYTSFVLCHVLGRGHPVPVNKKKYENLSCLM